MKLNQNIKKLHEIFIKIFCCYKNFLIFFSLLLFCSKTSFCQENKEIDFAEKNNNSEYQEIKNGQFYFLIDADSKEVILSKNSDVKIAPSSMTKIMTAYVVFDQIKKKKISLENQCLIGKDAWRKSGSSMFLNYGDIVSVDDLLKGLLVVSGNDAAIALAEASADGIDNFIAMMNIKARQIGLKNSHFKNPHGLNEDGHYMTLRDLANLIIAIYRDFPEYASYLSISEFTYRNITQQNRNPLIKKNYEGGVIGGKTGHTNEGGYGVIGMVKRDHRRLVAVVNKAKSPKQREKIITELFDYGFNKYKKLTLFDKNQKIANLPVWLGKNKTVGLFSDKEISINIPKEKNLEHVKATIKYKSPIYSPVVAGKEIATLVLDVQGFKSFEFPLFSKENIDKAGRFERINQILRYKIANSN
jgi:D-alanyl-D-alanine carboxypeptidase (penicillin-binding protein 5/6)